MSVSMMLRLVAMAAAVVLVAVDVAVFSRKQQQGKLTKIVLSVLAVANLGYVTVLIVNHSTFPLNLDLMEGTILQHAAQAAQGLPIYPDPTPAYVPLSYNPLYYVISIPFAKIFGLNLTTLRWVAILGMLGSGILVFLTVRRKTGQTWWGLIAIGLFAAAYGVQDSYLDNAHSDSWLLCAALLGTYLIDLNRSRGWNILGVLTLLAAFWFKQHGALFVIGGVLYLTWREGVRRALIYWVLAAVLGPVLYLLGGPTIFGPRFHYFTWEVPRAWTEPSMETVTRLFGFVAVSYPFLAAAAVWTTVRAFLRDRVHVDVWHVQFIFALGAAFMGALDPGSANNVFIPMGTWFIILGVIGLYQFGVSARVAQRYRLDLLGLLCSFALMLYNPITMFVPAGAPQAYDDLVARLNSIEGEVYAPSLGQLQRGYTFYPAAHWVALEDMVRGPGRDERDQPNTRRLLDPLLNPTQPTYILSNFPIDILIPALAFLDDYYVLDTDYGDQYKALSVLPKRFGHGWPRYLYRYQPKPQVQ